MSDPASKSAEQASRRLQRVRSRIEAACAAAGRSSLSVQLLAVSKTFEAERVLELAGLGQRAFAENYLQEALDKIAACTAAGVSLEWHFIGPVQSNKTRPVAESFSWVHSVDREKIGRRLDEQRPESLPPLDICLQVNVSGEDSKSGCPMAEAVDLALRLASLKRVRLRGLMTIPAPGPEALARDRPFETLRDLAQTIRARLEGEQPDRASHFDALSMGMSDDLEPAIAAGATIVRVGTALFGQRDPENVRPSP
jgi:pyridoxal phosphate enzyme (YggS family)